MKLGTGGTVTFLGINVVRGNEDFYSNWLMPAIHTVVDPETSHKLAISLAKKNLTPNLSTLSDPENLVS